MKKLYEASSALEAHMIVEMLRQQNIIGTVEGQYLTGAMGELPASGLVRIMVEEEDFPRAEEILQAWDNSQPTDSVASPVTTQKAWGGFGFGLALGFIMTAGLAYVYYGAPLIQQTTDRNQDGKIDETTYYSFQGMPLRTEMDRNFDGKNDAATVYVNKANALGSIESLESDDDFDGTNETNCIFEHNYIEHCATDTDGDGFADLKIHFKNSVLHRNEFIDRQSGWPIRIEYFKMGKLRHVELDTNNDGKLDVRIHYDARVEATSRQALN